MTIRYNCGMCMIELGSKEEADKHFKEKHPDAIGFLPMWGVSVEDEEAWRLHKILYGENKE